MSHKVPWVLWGSIGHDIFNINNIHYLSTVDYHNKFPLARKSLVQIVNKTCKIIFSE